MDLRLRWICRRLERLERLEHGVCDFEAYRRRYLCPLSGQDVDRLIDLGVLVPHWKVGGL